MGKRNSKGGSKKNKSKKCREKHSKVNTSEKEEKNSQKAEDVDLHETTSQDSVEDDSDIHTEQARPLADDLTNIFFSSTAKTSSKTSDTNTTESTAESNCDNINETNDCYEEIKAKQQELLNKLNNLGLGLTNITLIRDNINSIRVDTLTELYFIRQVRPLLDALNILSFSISNMTTSAVNIQANAFGDKKEIKHALNLSYKMNDEVEDIINSFERRLKIFLKQIDCMDKNCPPFDAGKDS